MTTARRALLLVGSAKTPGSSASETLGQALLDRLVDRGMDAEKIYLHRALRTPDRTAKLLAAVDAADLVVAAFPLYVDTLPYLVTQALEEIARHRLVQSTRSQARFAAIVNCGFPEVEHNAVAIQVCEVFARQSGLAWAGALALGGGGPVSRRSLQEATGIVRHVVHALDLAADGLAAGGVIPAAAVETMAQPMMPKRFYLAMGTMGWHLDAFRQHAHGRLHDRPLVARGV